MDYSSKIFLKESDISVSAIRIGIALAYLFTFINYPIFSDINHLTNYSYYDPKGILALFYPETPPSPGVWTNIVIVSIALSILYLLGICTKIVSLVLLFFILILFGIHESLNKLDYWSHGLVIMPITHLAFVFAPAGKISLDNFLYQKSRIFNTFLFHPGKSYFFYTVFPLIAISLMFFNAFCWKFYNSGIYWALSDNMRNILILQYTMVQNIEIPWYILKILHSEYGYKSIAILNLLVQFTPILALLFLNNPKIKLLIGLFFLLEILGLYFIVRINAMQWIPLFMVFVDWDYFLHRNNITIEVSHKIRIGSILFFSFSYLFFNIWVSFDFSDVYKAYKLNCFPISPFPMYSENVAKKPYNKHLSFERACLIFKISVDSSEKSKSEIERIENDLTKKYSDNYRGVHEFNDKRIVLKEIYNYLKTSQVKFKKLRVYYGFNSVGPFPASPFPKPINKGLYGEIKYDGAISYASISRQLNKQNRFYLTFENTLAQDSIEHIEYIYEMCGKPERLNITIMHDTIFYKVPQNGYYSFLIYTRGKKHESIIENRRYHSEIFGHWFN